MTIPVLTILAGVLMAGRGMSASVADIVYQNDFSSPASLAGFTTGSVATGQPVPVIQVAAGQLQVNSDGYAALNSAAYTGSYSSILDNNSGLITWGFNLSNQDGGFNNTFSVALASTAVNARIFTSSSYVFEGGGYVGSRMGLWRQTAATEGIQSYTPIIDITDGLGTLPQKGSFRITYDPAVHLWSLYGVKGTSYVDPLTVTTLLGSVTDSGLTGVAMPYTSISSRTSGSVSFDNYTISVVPEPSTACCALLGMAASLGFRRRALR